MNKNRFARKIWYSLPTGFRFLIRRIYYFPADFLDKISGKRNKYIPPRGLIYTGSPASPQEYLKQGQHQVNLLKQHLDILPNDCILDIGSGIGRTAVPLTSFLSPTGTYHGFDVVKKGVDWCNSRISRDFQNFHFKYIPLFNDLYNKHKTKADTFKFPYQDNQFNKIFSFSVFTHMQINEIENYFREMTRILKPEGKILSTFFIYENDSEEKIATMPNFGFPHKGNGYRLMDANTKSGNIAIHISKLTQMLNNTGLELTTKKDGFWKKEEKSFAGEEFQDVLVFKR